MSVVQTIKIVSDVLDTSPILMDILPKDVKKIVNSYVNGTYGYLPPVVLSVNHLEIYA